MSKGWNPNLTLTLVRWGAWRRGEIRGLGSLGYRSIDTDAAGGQRAVDAPNYWPDGELLEVDRALTNHLPPKSQLALWCRYVQDMDEDRSAIVTATDDAHAYLRLLSRSMELAAEALGLRAYTWSQRKKKLRPPSCAFLTPNLSH